MLLKIRGMRPIQYLFEYEPSAEREEKSEIS